MIATNRLKATLEGRLGVRSTLIQFTLLFLFGGVTTEKAPGYRLMASIACFIACAYGYDLWYLEGKKPSTTDFFLTSRTERAQEIFWKEISELATVYSAEPHTADQRLSVLSGGGPIPLSLVMRRFNLSEVDFTVS
jgi:hypothetical protein